MHTTICTLQNALFAYVHQSPPKMAGTAISWVLALALILHITVFRENGHG